MAKFDKKDRKLKKGEAPSSVDQALLDEFFSIIASIAARLTKDDGRDNNVDDSTSPEVSKE